MYTCSYCGTEVSVNNEKAYCSFCCIELGPNSKYGMYSVDGKRLERFKQMSLVTSETAKLPIDELYKLNPMDLLLCLKEARKERGFIYNQLRTFNKFEDLGDFAKEIGEEYEFWTRKCWTIENILINRFGYYPEKINSELIDAFSKRKEKSLSKTMVIRKKSTINN